jgi:hypothetical protein
VVLRGVLLVITVAGCRFGFGEAPDAPVSTVDHVVMAPGWSVAVYRDFSALHDYRDADFIDSDETYSNVPDRMIALSAPYPEELLVAAGRVAIELTDTAFVAHDFGQHLPDTPGTADALSCVRFVPDKGGVPTLLVSSSSRNTGDGVYTLPPSWVLAPELSTNNVRCAIWDEQGRFDARGTPEGYLSTSSGITRQSDLQPIDFMDSRSLRLLDPHLLVVRYASDTDMRLVRITSSTHAELELAQATSIELGDGAPPDGGLAWVLLDLQRLTSITPSGPLTEIARTSDPAFTWQAAVTPPAGHALATAPVIVYVLENSRALDLDRVLVLTRD